MAFGFSPALIEKLHQPSVFARGGNFGVKIVIASANVECVRARDPRQKEPRAIRGLHNHICALRQSQ